MKALEDHVPSLETCKALKEAGFKQDTYFQWVDNRGDIELWNPTEISDYDTGGMKRLCSAPLASELLEVLPNRFFQETFFKEEYMVFLTIMPELKSGWLVAYENRNFDESFEVHDQSLPEALAQMYLYLSKNNLLAPQVQKA